MSDIPAPALRSTATPARFIKTDYKTKPTPDFALVLSLPVHFIPQNGMMKPKIPLYSPNKTQSDRFNIHFSYDAKVLTTHLVLTWVGFVKKNISFSSK